VRGVPQTVRRHAPFDPARRERRGGKHPGAAPGTAYLVFHVADYDAFIAARAAQGLTPVSTNNDGIGRFASFHDPEGNELAVWGR